MAHNTNLLDTPPSRLYTVDQIGIRILTLSESFVQDKVLDSAEDAVKFYRENIESAPDYEPDQEQVHVLYLSTRMHLKHWRLIALGCVNSVITHAPDVLRPAVITGCPKFILMHNHPSGSPEPSEADIRITRTLIRAAETLQLELADHIIVGRGKHQSLRELGYIE